MAHLPRLFTSVSSFVTCPTSFSQQEHELLLLKLNNFRKDILKHYSRLQIVIPNLTVLSQLSRKSSLLYELFGTSLGALAMVNRLLGALGDPQFQLLETDAVFYASEIVRLERAVISANGWASFVLNQKANVASSIPTTTEVWICAMSKVIEKWRFDSWLSAMQRQTRLTVDF